MSAENKNRQPSLKDLSPIYSNGDETLQKKGERFLKWAGEDFSTTSKRDLEETPVYRPEVDDMIFKGKKPNN